MTPEEAKSGGARRWLVLAGAVALYLAQTVPLLSTRWVEDENWYSSGGYTLFTEGRIRNPTFSDLEIESKVDMRPPGTALATGVAYRTLGMSPWQARLPSLVMGLGTIVVVFALGVELGGFAAGAVAAVAAAADNFLFLAARTARPEAYVTFFDALAVLLYFVARRKRSFGLALASGAAVGISAAFHPTGLAVGAGLAAITFWECRWHTVRDRIAWALAIGFVLALTPLAARATLDAQHRESFRQLYGRGERTPWADLLAGERMRYADYIGVSSQRFALPVRVPLRLHIALLMAGAFAVLWARRRPLFWQLLLLLVPNLLWWVHLVNNTSRYYAIIGPILAVAAGAATVALWQTWPKTAGAALAVLVLTQMAGNAALLYRSRNADYVRLTAELRAAIPPGCSVYAANTFWLALYDHRLWSYMRTPLDYAVTVLKPDYMILNDRVMMTGFGSGSDDFGELRRQANEFATRHATRVAHIPDPFYGVLDVYRLDYGSGGETSTGGKQ